MDVRDGLLYSREHEWLKVDGDVALCGITDYAQDNLGDVVYVELPEVGKKVEKMKPFMVLESVKATSDVYSPVTGEIVEVNEKLQDAPELVNTDPYGEGWLVKIKLENKKELEELMDKEAYLKFLEEEEK